MAEKFHYTIPNPCQEDWNKMTPNKQGRHCALCDKTVVDFTKMSKEEIKDYFKQKAGQKVCGQFYSVQLNPERNFIQNWLVHFYENVKSRYNNPLIRKSTLFIFGLLLIITGCGGSIEGLHRTGGDIEPKHLHDTLKRKDYNDSLKTRDSLNSNKNQIDHPNQDSLTFKKDK